MLVPRTLVPIDVKAGVLKPVGQASSVSSLAASRTLVPIDAQPPVFDSRGSARSPLVGRALVPIDAQTATDEMAGQGLPGSAARPVSAGFWARQASAAVRPTLFVAALLENSPTRPRHSALNLAASLAAHLFLVTGIILVPLYFTEATDLHPFHSTLLVAPPAPAPPLAPAPAAISRQLPTPKKMFATTAGLVAPRVIPKEVAQPAQEREQTDSVIGVPSEVGVPGGIPGGSSGGAIGSIVSSASASVVAPTPSSPVPSGPVRVGGEIERPQLLVQTPPVYPVLARQAKIAGDVEIEAVIDPQGNVVEMRVVSGKPQLMSAAMEALRHWKYEPTRVGGQAVPIQLLVTITFRLS